MKVLILGARGRLGSAVVQEFRAHADVVALGRPDLDITDDASVLARVAAESPDVMINCAGNAAGRHGREADGSASAVCACV